METFVWRQLYLSAYFKAVVPPIDAKDFETVLVGRAFSVEHEAQQQTIVRLVGKKGSTQLALDLSRSLLFLTAKDPRSIVAEWREAEVMLREEFGVGEAEIARYEFIGESNVAASGRCAPLRALASAFSDSVGLKELSGAFGTALVPAGVKLTTPGADPRGVPYALVAVEPLLAAPEGRYYTYVFLRDTSREAVVRLAEDAEAVIWRMIGAVEKQAR